MCFVGLTPISWYSKRKFDIDNSNYSKELCSGRVAMEESILMRYMLSYSGVLVKVPTSLCRKNRGMIISSTNPDYKLKKMHVDISYHKLRESDVSRTVNPVKVCIMVNQSDILIN